jgi:hypothetical protein
MECLFFTTATCADTVAKLELAGYFAYRPFLMWIGVALWLAGVVLGQTHRDRAARLGGGRYPALWGIWITLDKALILFE